MKLKDMVYNSVLELHRKTGREWLHLKEIYSEVEKLYDIELKNSGASVRAILETHCVFSDAYRGEELYLLKEKGTGLYKAVVYDLLKKIDELRIGDILSRDQLMFLFKISGQSGIMKSNTLNCLVLTTSEENGIYEDGVVEDGLITYTGEGQIGDQTITKNNKSIYNSRDTHTPMYLFSKDKRRRYIFEGEVQLYEKPYQVVEKDINSNNRLVWKFPLQVIYCDDEQYQNDNYKEFMYEIMEVENKFYSDNIDDIVPIEYKEGPLNLRKYRKTGKKNASTGKKDYVAEEIVKVTQGKKNEKIIFEMELKRLIEEEASEQVKRMEEFFKNKTENEGYDILSFERNENGEYVKKYIEVKSTKGNEGTPIDITADEVEFARKNIDQYYLYR
ncbi:MAG: DUF3883 domain-containing protein, partial [Bacilli bacterium]|nr:DUF3883 domain-containing protein [Bacilli bacterium]